MKKINCADKHYFVVPSKALLEASRILKEDAENDCEIFVNSKHILFDINGYRIFTRLLEGEFHNYKNSVPKEFKTEVIVKTSDIVHCLERCSLLLNEKNKAPVKCTFGNGEIKINCKTGIGRLDDSIEAEINGESVLIGFNNKYLLDALKAADTDKVRIQMTGANRAVKIVPFQGDSFTFIVMPVQIKRLIKLSNKFVHFLSRDKKRIKEMRPIKRRGRITAHKAPNFIRNTVSELIGLLIKRQAVSSKIQTNEDGSNLKEIASCRNVSAQFWERTLRDSLKRVTQSLPFFASFLCVNKERRVFFSLFSLHKQRK